MRGLRQLALIALPCIAVLAACTLKANHCITMSDCDDGMTCNEGLCQSDSPGDSLLSADADTSRIEASTSSSSSSGSTVDSSTTAADAAADAADADAADASEADAPTDS